MWDNKFQFSCPAEPIMIDKIASKLDRVIFDAVHKEYSKLLEAAKKEVEKNYREAIEPIYCDWLQKVEYKTG
jgi:hypothetical protein